jgi:hypothetical protein
MRPRDIKRELIRAPAGSASLTSRGEVPVQNLKIGAVF